MVELAPRVDGNSRPRCKDALLHSSLQDPEGLVGLATNPALIGFHFGGPSATPSSGWAFRLPHHCRRYEIHELLACCLL